MMCSDQTITTMQWLKSYSFQWRLRVFMQQTVLSVLKMSFGANYAEPQQDSG